MSMQTITRPAAMPARRDKPRSSAKRKRANGVAIGVITRIGERGEIIVRRSGSKRESSARSIIALTTADVGRDVVLAFDRGQLRLPIIMGCIRPANAASITEVSVDGETIVLNAEREISLRCGKSSLTLTRAGKVLINGAYLLSRSTGVNRIKGGSVQIN